MVASLDRKRLGQRLRVGKMLIRGVFDKETRRKPLGVCGGRGALWDLNGSLGRESFVSGYEKVGLGECALRQRAARGPTEGREKGRGHWVIGRSSGNLSPISVTNLIGSQLPGLH